MHGVNLQGFFLLHGKWSEWMANGDCSVTCGEGTQEWRRNCANPEAQFGDLVTWCGTYVVPGGRSK